MGSVLAGVLALVLMLHGAESVQWSPSLEDGAVLYVCEGQDLTLPWHVTPDTGEHIDEITWLYGGHSEQMIAIYSHNLFLPSPSYSQRVKELPNGGIVLSHVTPGDAGKYTIAVNTDRSGVTPYRLSALVHVASVTTARTDLTLEVRQEPIAVYDNQTGQYHVQLTCTSRGRQPPAVIWTLPSQQTVKVSNDKMRLLVPNPVSGGNYTCRVPPDSPAASCLPKDDPALEGATFNIDKVDARLMLLEAENADLRTQVKALEKSATFHARLTSNSPVNTGDHIILTDVIINEGNVYNSSTGEFTAPYDGSYFFTATAVSAMYSNTTDQFANVDLMVDGDIVTYIWTKSVNYLETGTCSYTTHLNKGQRVWLQADYHGIFRAPETSFSGFLLSADD